MDSHLSALLELDRSIANPATDVATMLVEIPTIRDAMRSLDGHQDVLGELRSMFLAERPDIVELIDKSLEIVALRIEARALDAERLRALSQRN